MPAPTPAPPAPPPPASTRHLQYLHTHPHKIFTPLDRTSPRRLARTPCTACDVHPATHSCTRCTLTLCTRCALQLTDPRHRGRLRLLLSTVARHKFGYSRGFLAGEARGGAAAVDARPYFSGGYLEHGQVLSRLRFEVRRGDVGGWGSGSEEGEGAESEEEEEESDEGYERGEGSEVLVGEEVTGERLGVGDARRKGEGLSGGALPVDDAVYMSADEPGF